MSSPSIRSPASPTRADVAELFSDLRRRGVYTDEGEHCCTRCSWQECARDAAPGQAVVFFTAGDVRRAFEHAGPWRSVRLARTLYLHFGVNRDGATTAEIAAVGQMVATAAEHLGFAVTWEGRSSHAVGLLPRWRRDDA